MTADNDIRLDNDSRPAGKPIALPPPVSKKVRAILAHMLADEPELDDGLACDMLEESVYRVSGLGRAPLYVANVSLPLGPDFFFLILCDPRSGRVTQTPPRIGSKWPGLFGAQDSLVRTPIISSTDILKDGHRQIVFEERVHNGTDYNAVVYRYFDLLPNLGIKQILARETRLLDISNYDVEYLRDIRSIGNNKLRLDYYRRLMTPNKRPHLLGYSILERSGPGSAFHVSERHAAPGVAAAGLVTDCESRADNAFLRHGCDFYY